MHYASSTNASMLFSKTASRLHLVVYPSLAVLIDNAVVKQDKWFYLIKCNKSSVRMAVGV